jgi:hypothetical protein
VHEEGVPFDKLRANGLFPRGSVLMSGKFFDEWQVGDRLEHQPHRTVTETDNLLISTLTHNPQPLHLDAEYAGATEFGRIVVNGTSPSRCCGAFGGGHHTRNAGGQPWI